MVVNKVLVACFCFVAVIAVIDAKESLARGFNEDIDWVDHNTALERAKKENKLIFMLIHKSWCGACKALKPKFTTSMELVELSKQFVMVNLLDDEEPSDQQFKPDGGYIPRIFFLTSEGEVITKLYNKRGSEQYRFYYPVVEQILESMENALEYHQGKSKDGEL